MTSSAGCCLFLQRDHKEVCPVRGFYGTFATKSVIGFVSLEKKGLVCRYKVSWCFHNYTPNLSNGLRH